MLQLWASYFGAPVGVGPIWRVKDAEIVVAELGQFSSHTVTLPTNDPASVYALPPFTLIEIEQEGLRGLVNGRSNVIASGYVLNPKKQMSVGAGGQIELTIFPLTVEATWYRTRRGWVAATNLSIIAQRLGGLIGGDAKVPQWTGVYRDMATVDPVFSVRFENPTVLDAFLQATVDSQNFARQGRDATGKPARILEMGQFGADSGLAVVSADGGDANEIVADGTKAVVLGYEHATGDVETLVNICTPLGGGSGDSQVSLERLWRIINDRSYPNYGRWGTDADAIARRGLATIVAPYNQIVTAALMFNAPSGSATPILAIAIGEDVAVLQWNIAGTDGGPWAQARYASGGATHTGYIQLAYLNGSLFPEYDPVNYPIDCVESEQSGAVFYDNQAGYYGSRAATLDGRFDYDVYDFSSVVRWGTKRGEFMDSSVTYADSTRANQELTARRLYSSAIANFKARSQPHETWSVTATGVHPPPQGGDLLTIDLRDVQYDDDRAVVVEDAFLERKIMRVVRRFAGEEMPQDDITLSNLGRFADDDTVQTADAAHQLRSVQINQGTGLCMFPIWAASNVDANNPLHVPIALPKQVFRVQKASLRVDFFAYRGTSETSDNPAGTEIQILGSDTNAGIVHGDHNLAGTGVTDTGLTGTSDGFDLVQKGVDNDAVIKLSITNDPDPNIGSSPGNNVRIFGTSGGYNLRAGSVSNSSGGALINSSINFTKEKTKGAVSLAVNKAVAVATRLVAYLPQHRHPIEQKMPTNQPSPQSLAVTINGANITSAVTLLSGTRNGDGTFATGFEIDDISQYVDLPGTTIDLGFDSNATPGNPNGIGYIQVSGTWIVEIAGQTSVTQAA